MVPVMGDRPSAQRKVLELVRQWIEGAPGWFALEDDSGIVVVLGTALPRLLDIAFPCSVTSDNEHAIIAAVRELCEMEGVPCGCLALNEHVNIYYGAKDALCQQVRSPR